MKSKSEASNHSNIKSWENQPTAQPLWTLEDCIFAPARSRTFYMGDKVFATILYAWFFEVRPTQKHSENGSSVGIYW